MSPVEQLGRSRAIGVLPVALACVTTLAFAGRKSFWGDEAFSVALARLDWPEFWEVVSTRQANMALYYVALKAWLALGDGEAVVRALSALATIAAVWVVFVLARRPYGSPVALVAATALALNAFAVHYAQEARGYALAMLLVTCASLFFAHAIESRRLRDWTIYTVVAAVALYAHFFCVFVLVAHVVALAFVSRRPSRSAVLSVSAVALAGIPLLAFVLTQDEGQVEGIPGPTPYRVAAVGAALAGQTVLLAALYAVVAAVGLLVVWRRRQNGNWFDVLVVAWLVVPLIGSLAIAPLESLFLARYLLVSLPALAIVVAIGLCSLPRSAAYVVGVVGLVFAAHGLAQWYPGTEKEGLDFRAAAARLRVEAQPSDGIVFYRTSRRLPIEYYLRRAGALEQAPRPVFPAAPWGRFDLVVDYEAHRRGDAAWNALVASAAQRHARLWVVEGTRELDIVERDELHRAVARRYTDAKSTRHGALIVTRFARRSGADSGD